MYLVRSLIEGLKILGFDKATIKKTSKERSLEEIFLSTLFLNYVIVLVVYLVGISLGNYSLNGREINSNILFGLLMIYPFAFNLAIYAIYGFFGLTAELLNNKKSVKPLLAVGFHTGIVYSIIIYIISLFSIYNVGFGIFTLSFFALYFIYTMFLSVSTIYDYSMEQTLIVVFLPILVLSFLVLLLLILIPNVSSVLIGFLFN